MNSQNSIQNISHNYKGFLVDIWGVLHASGILYPNVLNALTLLFSRGQVVLLSNAPRRGEAVKSFLAQIGVLQGVHYHKIVTSGDVFINYANTHLKNEDVLFIGKKTDEVMFSYIPFKLMTNYSSNYTAVMLCGASENEEELIKNGLKNNTTFYCVNPDVFVTLSTGEVEKCAGFTAKKYEEAGGKVVYFGKPHQNAYDFAFANFDGIKKEEILAIGDGMETDILGANNFGIDSALCLSGLPSVLLKQGKTVADVLNHKAKPTFVINHL